MIAIDLIGWIGAALILLAFWLLTHKAVHSHSNTYLGLNLVGAIALVVEALMKSSHSFAALNFVWICVAIYGLGWAHKKDDPKK